MKQLLITIAALVMVGCGGDDSEKVRSNLVDETLVGDAKISMKMKYRDGKMLLKLKAYPYKGTIEKNLNQKDNGASIRIIFQDKDDFEITTFTIELDEMLNIGDQHLELDLTKTISEKRYNLIANYKIGSFGFVE